MENASRVPGHRAFADPPLYLVCRVGIGAAGVTIPTDSLILCLRRSRMRRLMDLLSLAVVTLLLNACAALHPLIGVPTQHIVMVESNGRLVDPTASSFCHPDTLDEDNDRWVRGHHTVAPPTSRSWHPCNGRFNGLWLRELDRDVDGRALMDGDRYLNDLFAEMDAFHTTHPGKRRVVIFIHGGLNNNVTTVERARETAQAMRQDGVYPVFLNWQSNLVGAEWEHLMNVRQGDHKGYRHFYLFPFYLAGDLARAFGRAPATWFYLASSNIDRVRHVRQGKQTAYDKAYAALRDQYLACATARQCNEIAIIKGPETHGWMERASATGRTVATGVIPTRYWAGAVGVHGLAGWAWLSPRLLAAPILDGLGGPSWDTMTRHAALPFHADGVANADKHVMVQQRGISYPEGNGGFARFFRRLQQKISCQTGDPCHADEWDITIIGHSMGTIVLNHALNEFPDLPIANIVYMAAATSVRDYERAVFPYMKRHPETRMFHLTLHDFAELRDQYFYEIPPAGSLLVWIDTFLAKPDTFRDRTAGSFANLVRFAQETPPELRGRISIKAFGVGRDLAATDPQHHGDFGGFNGRDRCGKFWDPAFWTVGTPRVSPQSASENADGQ